MRRYRVFKSGEIREVKSLSRFKPRFGAVVTQRLFGRVNCYSGKRANPENQVFFQTWEDLQEFVTGQRNADVWRACKNCHPHPDDTYVKSGGEWLLVPGDSDG